jgi:hypothetical protein
MSADPVQSFILVALGFAFAGLLASGYQYLTQHPPSFRLMTRGPSLRSVAAVPFLAFTAPFIIMRNVIFGERFAASRIEFVMLATTIAGFWSLMSGTLVIMALREVGMLFA